MHAAEIKTYFIFIATLQASNVTKKADGLIAIIILKTQFSVLEENSKSIHIAHY